MNLDMQAGRTLGLVFGPVAFLLILVLPPPGGLPPVAQAMIATAALMTIWWLTEAIPIPATSVLPLALFPLLEISSMQDAAAPYANQLVFLFLGGFMVALGVERSRLHRRIALQIIRRIGGNPPRVVFGFMVATAFLSMWISNTATTLMMLPIALAVTKHLAQSSSSKDEDAAQKIRMNFGLAVMLGIAYSASIGGIGTLIGTPPNIVLAGFVNKLYPGAPPIGFLQWMLFALPVVVVFLPVAWWLLVRVIPKIPLSRLPVPITGTQSLVRDELRALGPLSSAEKRMTIVFLITAAAWIFRSPIDLEFIRLPGLTDLYPRLTDATVAMAAGIALFVVPDGMKRKEFLMDWDTVQNGVPWGILLLFGGGFALADGLERTGVTLFLGQSLAGLHGAPLIVLVLLICTLLTFLTELTSNTATTTILLPVVGAAAVSLGQNPLLFMLPATLNASFAFMLPVATPPNAIVFSSTWITIRQMARAGFLLNIAGIILVTLTAILYAPLLFDITVDSIPAWVP